MANTDDVINPDEEVLQTAQSALSELQLRYDTGTSAEKFLLRPQLETAYAKFAAARIKLLESSIITKPEDVTRMGEIKKEIEDAADTQALIFAAARLVAFLVAL